MRHYANSRSFEDLFIACICTTAVTPLCYDQKATNVSQLTQFAYHNHTPWYRGNLWVTFGRSSSTWTMYVLDFFHWKKKGGFSIVLSRKISHLVGGNCPYCPLMNLPEPWQQLYFTWEFQGSSRALQNRATDRALQYPYCSFVNYAFGLSLLCKAGTIEKAHSQHCQSLQLDMLAPNVLSRSSALQKHSTTISAATCILESLMKGTGTIVSRLILHKKQKWISEQKLVSMVPTINFHSLPFFFKQDALSSWLCLMLGAQLLPGRKVEPITV